MADASYGAKVYMKQGADEHVIASGGKQTIESGGQVVYEAGSKVVRSVVEKGANYTVLASESGTIFVVTAADVKFTLPATVKGLIYTFVVKTLSTTTGLQVDPVAADNINGGTDNKDLINTAATDAVGDSVTIIGDGDAGWLTMSKVGTWAAEA